MSNRKNRRRKLLEGQGWRCAYCLKLLDYDEGTFDHINSVQRSRNKRGHRLRHTSSQLNLDNVVIACEWCNSKRRSLNAMSWFKVVQHNLKQSFMSGEINDPRRIVL